MYQSIVNPTNNKKISIYSKSGNNILKKYISQVIDSYRFIDKKKGPVGGASADEEEGGWTLSKAERKKIKRMAKKKEAMEKLNGKKKKKKKKKKKNKKKLELINESTETLLAQPDLTTSINEDKSTVTDFTRFITYSDFELNESIRFDIFKAWNEPNIETVIDNREYNTGLVYITSIEFNPTKIVLKKDGFNFYGKISTSNFNPKINESDKLFFFKNLLKPNPNEEINITEIIKKYLLYVIRDINYGNIIVNILSENFPTIFGREFSNINLIKFRLAPSQPHNIYVDYKQSYNMPGSKRFKIHISININYWRSVFPKIIKFFNDNKTYLNSMKFIFFNANHQYNKYNIDTEYTKRNNNWYEYNAGAATANFVIYPKSEMMINFNMSEEGKVPSTGIDIEQFYFKRVIRKLKQYCADEGIDNVGREQNNLFYNERVTKSLYIAYGSSSSEKGNYEQSIAATRDLIEQQKLIDISDWEISPNMKQEKDIICADNTSDWDECLKNNYNLTRENLCSDKNSPANFWFTKEHSKKGDDTGLINRCSFEDNK